MQGKLRRSLTNRIIESLGDFPAVAILGPRQCGKTTLARQIVSGVDDAVYLDLERPSDLRRLDDPEWFLGRHADHLVCLDEVQRLPGLFPVLRSLIDEDRRPGRFLLLGSASLDLSRNSAETLAGRISIHELTPFLFSELPEAGDPSEVTTRLWTRGGFPDSFLARSDSVSVEWRDNFIRTFLERDIPQLGVRIPSATLRRLWTMLAHTHGQLLNGSRLGESLGVSHTTVRKYIDLLSATYMVRVLPPQIANVRKRLVKSPKVYLRDPGILHTLLGLDDADALAGHPIRGASWEGLVVEQVLALAPRWDAGFYRTAAGAEVDLVLSRGDRVVAIEAKASTAPDVTRGFYNALEDVEATEAWIIAPVREGYTTRRGIRVASLADALLGLGLG